MNLKRVLTLLIVLAALLSSAAGASARSTAAPLGSGFTYQGRLNDDAGNPLDATCDFRFTLWDAATSGAQLGAESLAAGVAVADGYFTAPVNAAAEFGVSAFTGEARWLEIGVRCPAGSGSYTTLSPRQALTIAPYAAYASQAAVAPWSGLTGIPAGFADGVDNNTTYTAGDGLALSGTQFSVNFAGSGSATTAARSDHIHSNYWRINGNSQINPATNFIGTIDNAVLVFKVNNQTALRIEPNISSPNIIGGYSGNSVTVGVGGATIGGGGDPMGPNRVTGNWGFVGGGNDNEAGGLSATVSGGGSNLASDSYATVGGGAINEASGYSSIVSGGYNNTASMDNAVVGGGSNNTASQGDSTVSGGSFNLANGGSATVAGGSNNTANSGAATVGGGGYNTAGGLDSTVSGGWRNAALGTYTTVIGGYSNLADIWAATVAGGYQNAATGENSFAAGHYAEAAHDGAFVWSDASSTITFTSSAENQFLIQAAGGVGVNTNAATANALTVDGVVIAGGTGVPAGSTEPFVSRGNFSGISMDDRSGGTNPRWVVYPTGGVLRFWNGSTQASLSGTGVLTINGLGSAGSTTLCRNASNQISTCSSSIRYKDNIALLGIGLEAITQLRPVTFDWKTSGEADLGFVAEEVALISPLLVTYNAEGQVEGVKYDRVSAVLVNAMQEQQGYIAELKAQNTDLEARLAVLEQNAAVGASPLSTPWPWLALSVVMLGGMLILRRPGGKP